MRSVLLAGVLLLTGCVTEEELDQPLSPIRIRTQLAGHTLTGVDNGQQFYLHLARNGVASINGATAEFGSWRTEEQTGLCLRWTDHPEVCAPVYQLSPARYQYGNLVLTDFSPILPRR